MATFRTGKDALDFSAILVAHTIDAHELLAQPTSGPTRIVADLSLGSWTSQSLATQILGQLLGRELIYKPKEIKSSTSLSLGDAMSAGIDHEARGNSTLLTAFDTAKKIILAVSKSHCAIIVVVCEYTVTWRYEDQLLIEYLRTLDPYLDISFVVFGTHAPVWPVGWRVSCKRRETGGEPVSNGCIFARLPSAIPPSILNHVAPSEREATLALGGGWAIVRPEFRATSAVASVWFNRSEVAAMAAGPMRRFAVYAVFHSSREPADCWYFCREAWHQFDVGYRNLAFIYMQAALDGAASASDREAFICQLQAMRVASARYSDAASIAIPASASMQFSRGFLLETKGWGAVMSDSPQQARQCLSEALSLSTHPEELIPHLFLLNIMALAELRCGDHEAAYALEMRIESTIALHKIEDARLRFINSINIARLMRYSGKLDEATRYYDLAFSTADGGRSESDQVNANLSRARVEDAKGSRNGAFQCWLRATLHWIASECPESLGWRIQGLILGKAIPGMQGTIIDITHMVEKSAEVFLNTLKLYDAELTAETARAVANAQTHVCAFASSDRIGASTAPMRCIGGPGWSVVGASTEREMRTFGPHYDALISWLCAWIQRSGYRGERCYIVDVSNGTEMPVTLPDVRLSAAEFGVTDITYDGIDYHLDQDDIRVANAERRLTISPIVARISRDSNVSVVHFRRYFPTYELTPGEQLVFQTIGSGTTLRVLQAKLESADLSFDRIVEIVRNLRKKRVVQTIRPANVVEPVVLN